MSLLQKDNGVPVAIFATPAQVTHWRELTDSSRTSSRGGRCRSTTGAATRPRTSRPARFPTVTSKRWARSSPRVAASPPTSTVAGAAAAVVISHGFWLRRLGGDPDVVGTTLTLNGVPHTVVGVTSSEFDVGGLDVRGFGVPEAWVPLQVDADATDFSVTLDAFARLRDGVSLRAAQAAPRGVERRV